ncbi:MAG: plastocyanin/azurin family copper-binding protein [Gemmatimonadales bacterium]
MRSTWIATLAALGALACGEKKTEEAQTPQPDARPAVAAPAGAVVGVKMTGNGSTMAAFEPAAITVAPGTTVRFINVSGFPHNVAFWGDSIPAGAATMLNAAMPNRMDNLSGPFATTLNETYDVTFAADAPQGAYKGYCLPHLALGMRLTITVQ